MILRINGKALWKTSLLYLSNSLRVFTNQIIIPRLTLRTTLRFGMTVIHYEPQVTSLNMVYCIKILCTYLHYTGFNSILSCRQLPIIQDQTNDHKARHLKLLLEDK